MKLNKLIMRTLDLPCVLGERLRDWLEDGERETKKQNPLSRRCYLKSEANMGGYSLIVGFETLEDLDAAHAFLVCELKPNSSYATPASHNTPSPER